VERACARTIDRSIMDPQRLPRHTRRELRHQGAATVSVPHRRALPRHHRARPAAQHRHAFRAHRAVRTTTLPAMEIEAMQRILEKVS